jgi:hypothetical protein
MLPTGYSLVGKVTWLPSRHVGSGSLLRGLWAVQGPT